MPFLDGHYLVTHRDNQAEDIYSLNNRTLADLCLRLLAKDTDGYSIVHYLGKSFRDAVTQSQHDSLYMPARTYIAEQLQLHRQSGNSALAFRYTHLQYYFDSHPKDEA